ncbi:hypothetical protein G6F54_014561 [Rhizopus delemar]|nr:hypothetical protein G6F54_014561 [Rhizopus delemar]
MAICWKPQQTHRASMPLVASVSSGKRWGLAAGALTAVRRGSCPAQGRSAGASPIRPGSIAPGRRRRRRA